MSSSTRVLFDEPGPQARRRILLISIISLLVIAAAVTLAILRFYDSGQLDAAKWNVFALSYVQQFLWDGLF
jgi:glutamate transport system permease protein